VADTGSDETNKADAAAPRAVPHLIRVFAAHAPEEPPQRHALLGLDEVEIGRAPVSRRSGSRLRVGVSGTWASERHARIVRALGRWQIEDLESKNGTWINGTRVTRSVLADRDVVEIGHTLFVYLRGIVWSEAEGADAGAVSPLDGVPTLYPELAGILGQLASIATSTTSLVICGPTGSGKEVVARSIHVASKRSGPFVPVNCGALPRELVESMLFGHRRGAFSGAVDDEVGLVRSSHRGTLFLDEIGDLPLQAQAALLRVLQEREVMAVGSTRTVPVDLRVVAATHRDLAAMVAQGTFRADLLHRLTGFMVALPPLNERPADLGLLITRILAQVAPDRIVDFHPRVARALFSYRWPGNIRELAQVIGAAVSLAGTGSITVDHLPAAMRSPSAATTAMDGIDRDRLLALLDEHRGNVRAIARALGKDPVQIRRWLRRHSLDADRFRTP
jgi:transcriptional regulator of acetoin/glycerol metabolism